MGHSERLKVKVVGLWFKMDGYEVKADGLWVTVDAPKDSIRRSAEVDSPK